jgi:hypothetical protein
MLKKIVTLSALIFLAGCEPSAPAMSSVMNSCETKRFGDFNSCIQQTYTRDPNHKNVRSLYARLNAIEEDRRRGRITHTKAKALAYAAYDATVGAGNDAADAASRQAAAAYLAANRPLTCNTYGTQTVCY